MPQQHPVSGETLKAILDAFNAHDLDAIMEFFADDCSFDMPRGPEPWGQRFTGKAAVREALATRFSGLPDVHYGEDRHWVSGNLGVSEWLLTGTTPDGRRVLIAKGAPESLAIADVKEQKLVAEYNANKVMIEFYLWRRYHGVRGRGSKQKVDR